MKSSNEGCIGEKSPNAAKCLQKRDLSNEREGK